MKCNLFKILGVILLTFVYIRGYSQTAVFASLNGTGPSMNTTGWTLLGSADLGGGVPNLIDTNGDVDAFNNELNFAPQANMTAGGIFFNGFMDINANCNFWIADFDIRIFDGNPEGMAFIVTSAIPASTPTFSGGALGLPPGGITGFSVCFDGFNNCPGTAPQLEIRYNGTNECDPGPTVTVPALIGNSYYNVRVVYNNGNIDVYLNGSVTPTLTGFYNLNFNPFFGFTAANGGGGDALYTLKNASILVAIPNAAAGIDQSGCEGTVVNLGSPSFPYYAYSWTPSTGLNFDTVANPLLTIVNNGTVADTFDYIITSTIGTCALMDTVSVWAVPYPDVPVIQGPANPICEGQFATLSINPIGNEVYTWYDAAVGGNVLTTGVSYTTPPLATSTTFYIEAVNNATCTGASRGSFTVLVNAAPASPTASAAPVCAGDDGIFLATAPPGVTFVWYTTASGGLPIHTGANPNIGPVFNDTTLYVSATDVNGCVSVLRSPVFLSVDQIPPAPVVPAVTVCHGEQATLTAQPIAGTTIRWYSNPSSTNPLATGNVYVTPALSQNIIFYVNASTSIGCTGPNTVVNVTVNPRPDTAITIPDTICPGETGVLSVAGPAGCVFKWYPDLVSTLPIHTGPNYATSATISSIYYVESVLNGCAAYNRSRVQLLVDYIPPTPVVKDIGVCKWTDAILQVTAPSTDVAHFEWYDLNGGLVEVGTYLELFDIIQPHTYIVKSLSYLANCPGESDETVNVTLNPSPTANFYFERDTVEVNQIVYFTDSSYTSVGNPVTTGLTLLWQFGDGNYSTHPEPFTGFPAEGLAPVTLIATNSFGCKDTITKEVFVYDIRDVWIPSAFSPNLDRVNDDFFVMGSYNLQSFKLVMFDRWGKVVYDSNNVADKWDGLDKRKGEPCPEGVYICVIEYTTAKGVKKTNKSSVTLLR